jgi:hypothetical protein
LCRALTPQENLLEIKEMEPEKKDEFRDAFIGLALMWPNTPSTAIAN